MRQPLACASTMAKCSKGVPKRRLSLLLASVGLALGAQPGLGGGAEPIDEVLSAISQSWEGLCQTVPVGGYLVGEEVDEDGTLSLAMARSLAAWGETDFFTVNFSTFQGETVPFDNDVFRSGGFVEIELSAASHPDISEEQFGTVCVRQGIFDNFLLRSITPVTLEDGRPGRVMVYDYDASWSEPMRQRYGDLSPDRTVAILVSFNPGTGWGQIEGYFPTERGSQLAPDLFAQSGLSHFELAAPHPHRIVVEGVGGHTNLVYRFPHGLPEEVGNCADRPLDEIGQCLETVASSGAILGRLSVCERDDIGCMRNLLLAPSFTTLPDQCMSQANAEQCSATLVTLRLEEEALVEPVVSWNSGLIRSRSEDGSVAVHLRGTGTRYDNSVDGALDDTNRPWVNLICRHDEIAASLSFPAMPSYWQNIGSVPLTVVQHDGEIGSGQYRLAVDSDGYALTVKQSDTDAFLRDLFGYLVETTGMQNGVEAPVSYYDMSFVLGHDQTIESGLTLIYPVTRSDGETAHLWEGMSPACVQQMRDVLGESS